MSNLDDILHGLSLENGERFGVVSTGLDQFPGAEDMDAKGVRVSMSPKTAEGLLDISNALTNGNLHFADIVLYPGNMEGESLRGVIVEPLRESFGEDETRIDGSRKAPREHPKNGCDFKICVNSRQVVIVLLDEDENRMAGAFFSPKYLAEAIGRASKLPPFDAVKNDCRKTEGPKA